MPLLFARTATACLLLSLPAWAAATACLYRGNDASARVIKRSGEISTPFPDAQSAPDCRRLRVASGSVTVYALSADRSAVSSRQVGVDGGSLMPPSESTGMGSDAPSGLMRQISVVLEGMQRVKTGSSRGGEGEFLLAALPSGRLAEPGADLRIILGPVPDANLGSFELLVDGKLVYSQQGAAPDIKLPAAHLKAGTHALWRLSYAGQQHEGRFAVEPPATFASLQDHLAQQVVTEQDPVVARLRMAAGLAQQGYEWDARELIRVSLKPGPSAP
jgi:hypothetical protein